MLELLGMINIGKIGFIAIATVLLLLPRQGVFGATNPVDDFCSSSIAQADAGARAECENLKSLQTTNTKIKGEKDSIEKEIRDIDNQIQIAQQKIKVQNLIISKLSTDIGVKSKTVTDLQAKIDSNVVSLSSILSKVNKKDDMSIVEVFLSFRHFSDFYTQIDAYSTLNREITTLVNSVRSTKIETEAEKVVLEDRKDRETDAKAAIEEQKRLIDRKKAEKNTLLTAKKSELGFAQKLLTTQQQKVAQIRAKLFKFQDGEGIPFGDAYDYAVKASAITGVRPAMVLGILTQESSYDVADSTFGKNVGKCFLRDAVTGNGVSAIDTSIPRQRVMKPDRIPAFQKLTGDLGRDWMNTRISCWIVDYDGGLPTGWGGAMGPAQFIATTWDNGKSSSITNRTAKALGISLADPWNPAHAIMASSIFLADLGAGTQRFSDEKNAACQYYSGKKCSQSTRANSYGVSAMKHVTSVQEDIDVLLGK